MSADLFRPVATRRTFEEAIDQIADAIRDGGLRAGDRLPPERELAATMEISRPTLREAIRTLADAGIVSVRPGASGGTFVASEIVPLDVARRHAGIRLTEVSSVLEARRLLEPRVAQLAGVHGTDRDFDAMQRTIDLQRALDPEDSVRFNQLDVQFHLAVARATRNSTLVGLMRTLLRQVEIVRDMAARIPHYPGEAIEIHVRTIEAIRSRDAARIEGDMHEHIGFLERLWQDEIGPSAERQDSTPP